MKKVLGLYVAVLALLALAGNAQAAIDLTGITFVVTPVETIAGLMIAALAIIWVARKVKGFVSG